MDSPKDSSYRCIIFSRAKFPHVMCHIPLLPVHRSESRWRNSHVLVYHGPLLSDLLGVAPSTFRYISLVGDVFVPDTWGRLQYHHVIHFNWHGQGTLLKWDVN